MEDAGLRDSVQLLGAQPMPAVRAALAWADVLVHAAVTEGFCVSALEAQAMGVPVVCTDAGGLPENVVDGVTGFIVPRRDAAALADGLDMIVRMPFAREHLGRAGRRRVLQHFGFAQQIAAFGDLYTDLLRLPADKTAKAPAPSEETLDARISRIETALAAAEWMVRTK
jgi:colanic acid/amylovoran biosynthesis glycosyltransferase